MASTVPLKRMTECAVRPRNLWKHLLSFGRTML